MLKITKEQWKAIPNDYKGIWTGYNNEKPEWIGKKTVLEGCIINEASTALLIEGVHFEISK